MALPLLPIIKTVTPLLIGLLVGRADSRNRKDEEKFQAELSKIKEENRKAMDAALASIKTQQETRITIQREMFKKEQELLNFVNAEVTTRFDQLIELHIKQNVHNVEKLKQIEYDLNSLSNIEKELQEIFSIMNYKAD